MRHSLKLYITVFFVLLCTLLYICLAPDTIMDEIYERLSLGFNNEIVDSCDYLDYGELTKDKRDKNNCASAKHPWYIELKTLLNDIKNDSRVDIAMLVETWLNKNNDKRLKIPGYQFFGFHRKQKRGGGVGILVSQELQCRTRKDLCLNVPNFEPITLEIRTNSDSFFVCTIYRPPNGEEKEFTGHYEKILGKFEESQIDNSLLDKTII